MMGDVIKLSQARKDKARTEKQRLAAANRLKFGRSKAEKKTTKAEDRLSAAKLDGHKREP